MLSLILKKNSKLKKNYLVVLKLVLNKYIKKVQVKSNSLNIKTITNSIYPLIFFLKNHTMCQFKLLTDILCYDKPAKKYRFSLIYNILSLDYNYRVKVQIKLKEKKPLISTMTSLYGAAGWLEREVWDLFGIYFINNRDLRRILTDYGFKGYPLRKDFPLTGFIEVIYDDSEKQVVYKEIDLSQDFRNYKFKNAWKNF